MDEYCSSHSSVDWLKGIISWVIVFFATGTVCCPVLSKLLENVSNSLNKKFENSFFGLFSHILLFVILYPFLPYSQVILKDSVWPRSDRLTCQLFFIKHYMYTSSDSFLFHQFLNCKMCLSMPIFAICRNENIII